MQGRTQDLELGGSASGVSRISARGVLKVRPHTKSGRGGGAVHFRSDIRKWGEGGANSLQVRYEKWGGGGGGGGRVVSYPDPDSHSCGWITSRSGDVIHPQLWESGSGYETRGGGGGGGGPVRFRSDTFVWHTENTYLRTT